MPRRALPTRTCDECRARKRKCVLPPTAQGTSSRCNACCDSSLRCTFDLLYKKRGPQAKPRDILVRLPDNKNVYDLSRALDAFCPKPPVDFLVQNFMDHLYPVTPAVHKPSFFARLNDERHLHDPVFFSLFLSVLVITVCTLPGMIQSCKEIVRSFTHASRKGMLETGERLILRIRPADYYDVLSLDKWACAYLHVVANGQLNLMRRAMIHHAEAAVMAKELKLHVADAYNGLGHIEQQLRKKALWMQFTCERHLDLLDMSIDQTRSYVTQMTRAMEDLLPLNTDDEFITEEGILNQPEGRCSLTAGLNGMTAININLMKANPANSASWTHAVELQRGYQPSCTCLEGTVQPEAVRVAKKQFDKLEHCLDGLHEALSPNFETSNHGHSSLDSELLDSQLDTMKANLHVTHLWAQNLLVEQMRASSEGNLSGRALMLMDELCWSTQERVGRRLLNLLHTLPRINLLANGLVLVVKTRSVGASILEYANTRNSETSADLQDLVQSLATILAELDLEHDEANRRDSQ